MGPRKRSKPNPKAEAESVPEEPSLDQAPKLQHKDSLKAFAREPIPSSKPEAVDNIANNGAKTVSAEDDYLASDDTNP